jgi:hypothetical protein
MSSASTTVPGSESHLTGSDVIAIVSSIVATILGAISIYIAIVTLFFMRRVNKTGEAATIKFYFHSLAHPGSVRQDVPVSISKSRH